MTKEERLGSLASKLEHLNNMERHKVLNVSLAKMDKINQLETSIISKLMKDSAHSDRVPMSTEGTSQNEK